MTMIKVGFYYRQAAVCTVTSECDVPAKVVTKGRDAVYEYIHDHGEKWEDVEVAPVEYGDVLTGPRDLTVAGKALA